MPPPPALPIQPPRKNWWSRNWKWFVPTGCFTLIVISVVFVVCIIFFVFAVLKSSDAYKIAVERAKADPRLVTAIGTPIREGMFPSGKTNVNGPSGDTDMAISISGPKGKATIYAVGTKSAGKWTFSKLTADLPNGETIDLNQSAKPKRAAPKSTSSPGSDEEEAEEQTTDERIDAITLAHEEAGRLKPVKNFARADNPEHIVVKLAEGAEGTHVKTVWTNLNAGGATNQKLWTKELVPDDENRTADFSLSNSGNRLFPPGDYKIDIYLDDELVQTLRYKVE